MLTFFPTPYPSEWWYSVLCRYYVRSGWMRSSACLRELYGDQRLNHGTLFPNIDCYATIRNIPLGIFDLKKILMKHTLMPYYLRFYSLEKKEQILNDFLSGINVSVSKMQTKTPKGKQMLKFCPLCYTEDLELYGEPYWHREHQIPLISICPKHRNKLHIVEISLTSLSDSFLPLCNISNSVDIIQVDDHSIWEYSLTNALLSILLLPFEVSPPHGYSNLRNALHTKGFGNHSICTREVLDSDKLYRCCVEFYGKDISEQYFKKNTYSFFNRICKWKAVSPEPYALLSVFAGLSIENLFEAEICPENSLVNKLLEYKEKGVAYHKEELAKLVGISSDRLDSLANAHNIEPFWTQRKISRPKNLTIKITSEEKQKILAAVAAYGNGPVSAFARTILLQEAKRILEEKNEEDQNEI